MNPSIDPAASPCVDTAMAQFARCPGCGASTLICPGEEATACIRCLFALGLDDSDAGSPAETECLGRSPLVYGTLGPYELLEEIGRGGMGVIYKARHPGSGELVAIKALLPTQQDATEARARFEREARAMAALHHPYVMPIHEVCLDGQTPYFSMDLATGGSLAELLPKFRGRWRQAAQLMVQVAQAVQCAHEQGLLHRDLKPGNILFTEDFQPLVSDFGLAKWLDETQAGLTRSLIMFGTPNYVSPEQAAGKLRHLTAATDVYSLGAVFFELLTGRPPFVGDNPMDVLQQTLADNPPRLRSLAPMVPKDLEAVCMRCLVKEPAGRYPSVQEFSDDIERWLQGRKIQTPNGWKLWLNRRYPSKPWSRIMAISAPAVAVIVTAFSLSRPNAPGTRPVGAQNSFSLAIRVNDWTQDDALDTASDRLVNALKGVFDDTAQGKLPSVRRLVRHSPDDGLLGDSQGDEQNTATTAKLQESVRVVDSHLRVVSRLNRSAGGELLWAQIDALPLHPSDQELTILLTGLRTKVGEQLRLIEKSPNRNNGSEPIDSEALAFYKKAVDFYQRGTKIDNDNAITVFQKALAIEPNYVQARADLANAYRMQFEWWTHDKHCLVLAEDSARQALKLDAFSAEAHRALGACYLAECRYREAREEFLQTLEINPTLASVYFSVGYCWKGMGNPQKALPWLLRAAQLDRMHGTFNAGLGEVYMLLGEDSEAEHSFHRAAEIDPDQPHGSDCLSILYLWQEKWDEAQRISTDLATRFPEFTYKRELVAEVAFFSGKDAEALAYYKKMAADNSYSAGWQYFGAVNPSSAVACLLINMGDKTNAQRELADALSMDERLLAEYPNNCRLLHDLAAIWILRGDYSRGMAYLHSALAAGWVERRSTLIDPRFRSLSKDKKFVELMNSAPPQNAPLK